MGVYRDLLDDKNYEINELKQENKQLKKTIKDIKKHVDEITESINYFNTGFGKTEDLINEILFYLEKIRWLK